MNRPQKFLSLLLALAAPTLFAATDIKSLPQWRDVQQYVLRREWDNAMTAIDNLDRNLTTTEEHYQITVEKGELLALKAKQLGDDYKIAVDATVRALQQVIKANPKHKRVNFIRFKLGEWIFNGQNDFQNCVPLFATIIKEDVDFPYLPACHNYLAKCADRSGDLALAATHYKMVVQLSPDTVEGIEAKNRLQTLVAEMGSGDALNLRQSGVIEGSEYKNILEMAKLKGQQKKWNEAIALYQQVIDGSTTAEEAYSAADKLAGIYEKNQKEYQKAAKIYKEYADRWKGEPTAVGALEKAAKIYETDLKEYYHATSGDKPSTFRQKQDNYLEAIRLYRDIVDNYQDSSGRKGAMMSIGRIYEKDLKQKEEAQKAYEQVVSEYPGTAEAEQAQGAIGGLNQ